MTHPRLERLENQFSALFLIFGPQVLGPMNLEVSHEVFRNRRWSMRLDELMQHVQEVVFSPKLSKTP